MTVHRHFDFSPGNWREFDRPPHDWLPYDAVVSQLNPLAYYRLDETSGVVAADHTGQRPATYAGNFQLGQAGALHRDPDRAARFNGSDTYLDLNAPHLLNGAAACSFLFWMRYDPSSITRDGGLLSKGSAWQCWVDQHGFLSGRQRTLTVGIPSNRPGIANARVEGSDDLVRPGIWDFFAITFTGSDAIRIYRNGQLDRQGPVAFPTLAPINADPWVGRVAGSIGHVDATLDEIAIFDHALSPPQLLELYDRGVGTLRHQEPLSP